MSSDCCGMTGRNKDCFFKDQWLKFWKIIPRIFSFRLSERDKNIPDYKMYNSIFLIKQKIKISRPFTYFPISLQNFRQLPESWNFWWRSTQCSGNSWNIQHRNLSTNISGSFIRRKVVCITKQELLQRWLYPRYENIFARNFDEELIMATKLMKIFSHFIFKEY